MAEKSLIEKMTELSVLDDLLLCSYTKCAVKIQKTGLEVEPTNKISRKKCWTENKVFTNYDDLITELGKTKKFECDQCDYRTATEFSLKVHRRTHSQSRLAQNFS